MNLPKIVTNRIEHPVSSMEQIRAILLRDLAAFFANIISTLPALSIEDIQKILLNKRFMEEVLERAKIQAKDDMSDLIPPKLLNYEKQIRALPLSEQLRRLYQEK